MARSVTLTFRPLRAIYCGLLLVAAALLFGWGGFALVALSQIDVTLD